MCLSKVKLRHYTRPEETMAALDVAVARVAPDMIPRYVSETMRGYAMLGGVVKDELGLPVA